MLGWWKLARDTAGLRSQNRTEALGLRAAGLFLPDRIDMTTVTWQLWCEVLKNRPSCLLLQIPVNMWTQPAENSPPELAYESSSDIIWEGVIVCLVDCVLNLSENYVKKNDEVNQVLLFLRRPICVYLLFQILVINKLSKMLPTREKVSLCLNLKYLIE